MELKDYHTEAELSGCVECARSWHLTRTKTTKVEMYSLENVSEVSNCNYAEVNLTTNQLMITDQDQLIKK